MFKKKLGTAGILTFLFVILGAPVVVGPVFRG
jgi:hypothetical protein